MAIFWIIFGITISIWSATFPFGGPKDPGPAYFPLACGLIFILLGMIMLFQRKAKKGEIPLKSFEPLIPQWPAAKRIIFTLGGMLVFALLLKPLGFVLTVFLLILFLVKGVQPQKWRVALFYAFVSASGSFTVFKVLLKTSLPRGPFGF